MPMILVFGNLRHKDCHEKPTPAPFSGEDPGISFAGSQSSIYPISIPLCQLLVSRDPQRPHWPELKLGILTAFLSFIPMSLLTLHPLTTCLQDPSLLCTPTSWGRHLLL